MGFPYTWVRATEDATWVVSPPRPSNSGARGYAPHRYYVRVLVPRAIWQVDRKPVEVVQGLVIGFDDEEQAEYFLKAHDPRFEEPRCGFVTVVPGMHVVFYDASDALLFTGAGKAEISSEEEAVRAYTARLAAHEAGEDDEAQSLDEFVAEAVAQPEVKPSKRRGRSEQAKGHGKQGRAGAEVDQVGAGPEGRQGRKEGLLMSDRVVNFEIVRSSHAEVDLDGCVQALRDRVDSGEAVAIAYAVVNKDGSVSSNYVHGPQLLALLGGVHHLASRLEREINVP